MRCLKFACLGTVVLLACSVQAKAQGFGLGTRIANLPIFNRDDASSAQSAGRNPRSNRTASRSTTPTAPRQSDLTFAPSPLAPQASVTMPAPTSPAGNFSTPTASTRPRLGSRIWNAAANARESMAMRPREVQDNGPLSLTGTPDQVQAPVYVAAARVFEGQGRLDRAAEQYEKALAAEPKSFDAMVGFARLRHREGDLVAATNLYQRALKAHPDSAIAMNDLGLCYARRGMMQQAEASLNNAVASDPRSALYRNNLALVLVESHRDDEALSQLTAVHGEAAAHYNLAFMLREKGRTDDAAYHLRAALQQEPALEPARQMLAALEQPAPNGPEGGALGRPQWETTAGQPGTEPAMTASNPQPQRIPYGQATPVRMRIEDTSTQPAPQANSHYNAYPTPEAQPEQQLRRAPLPGEVPEYMRGGNTTSPSDNGAPVTTPRSRWGD